jgi:hypothetical protein
MDISRLIDSTSLIDSSQQQHTTLIQCSKSFDMYDMAKRDYSGAHITRQMRDGAVWDGRVGIVLDFGLEGEELLGFVHQLPPEEGDCLLQPSFQLAPLLGLAACSLLSSLQPLQELPCGSPSNT